MGSEILMAPEPVLRRVCEEVLVGAGVCADDAATVADTIVEANLSGVDSHGVSVLPTYLKRLRAGATNPRPRVAIVREGASFAVYDGDNGLGAITAVRAMRRAVEEAREKGAYLCLCRNNTTFGAAFYYSMMAAGEGMIGVTMCNAPPSVAPWGGRVFLLGTNPVSIAVPAGDQPPIVLDMATSAAAKSKIYLARDRGEPIPPGWAVDSEGRSTTDPEEALKGALLPLGGHKGYGISLMVDILAGALSGAGCLDGVGSLHHRMDRGQNVGFLLAAVNPAVISGDGCFEEAVRAVAAKVRSCPPAKGTERVLLPGEIEEETKRRRLADGIPVPRQVVADLEKEAGEMGIRVTALGL
ncbi:MAG: Ldh family oxidoreductase [Firmicutes bacterium]|nr:Ldh family oxidoreductase [Bacillota bacterium]